MQLGSCYGGYLVVGIEDGKEASLDGEVQLEVNQDVHEQAERAAFQLAVELMREVN